MRDRGVRRGKRRVELRRGCYGHGGKEGEEQKVRREGN